MSVLRRQFNLDFSEETQQYLGIGKHIGIAAAVTMGGYLGVGGRCSNCNRPAYSFPRWWEKAMPNFRLLKADGTELTASRERILFTRHGYVNPSELRKAQKLRCNNCGHTWAVYRNYQEPVTIVETHITEQPIGTTQRELDNSDSRIPLHRDIKLTKQWSRDLAVEYEKMRTVGTEMSAATKLGGDLKRNVDNQLRSKYAVSETSTEIYEDTVTVDVPAGERWIVVTNWKKISQHGMLQFQDQTEVPFHVAVRVEYDQKYITPDQ